MSRRNVRRSLLHCASAGAAKAPYPQSPSSSPNCDRVAGSQFGSGERPWIPRRMECRKCTMMTPKGDAQSAETFREVGMDETDGGRLRFSEKILGLRLAPCPLSFLGRLKPFFSFWQRKKRMGSKKRALKRAFGCGGNRKKRADRVVRPYGCSGRSEVVTMYCYCSQTLIRLLRRHLPRGEGNPLRRG